MICRRLGFAIAVVAFLRSRFTLSMATPIILKALLTIVAFAIPLSNVLPLL